MSCKKIATTRRVGFRSCAKHGGRIRRVSGGRHAGVWGGGRRCREHHDSLAPGTVSRVETLGRRSTSWARACFGHIQCGLCAPPLPRLWGQLNRGVLGADSPVGTVRRGESRQRGLTLQPREPRSTTGPEALASDDSPVVSAFLDWSHVVHVSRGYQYPHVDMAKKWKSFNVPLINHGTVLKPDI